MAPAFDESSTPHANADELHDLQESIAQGLSTISDLGDVPVGCDVSADPFTPEDVTFSNSAWLLRVCQVQGWLHLDDTLLRRTVQDSPQEAATSLFASLGCEQPERCFSVNDNHVQLTLVGAEALNNRLSLAEKLRDLFFEHLEDGSRREATAAWQQAWEEEESSDAAAPIEQIKAKTDNWRIVDFAGRAKNGRLNLNPSYQRGDVWPNADAQKLIESVLRGIPLPSIIILKPKAQSNTVTYEVVDGKQRLTALLRFVGKHPTALKRVQEASDQHPTLRLRELFESDYRKFKRLWKTHMGETLTAGLERTYYFPFALSRSPEIFRDYLEPLAGKYFYEIREAHIYVGAERETVQDVFEGAGEYKIPLIEYTDATARQIHTVFHLYNRQGKHLNAEEIRNAVHHEVALTRLLLAAAGDNTDYGNLRLSFLGSDSHPRLSAIKEALSDYRFGVLRYKRTKVLSWVVATLMRPALENGSLVARSTARHINDLLSAIEESDGTHPLCDHARLRTLVADLAGTLTLHSSFDGWAARFKDNDTGVKWQELQLVASIVACFILHVAVADSAALLDGKREEVLRFTAEHLRPQKVQNKEQWGFIGSFVLGLLDTVGIPRDIADAKLLERYRYSCLDTLVAAAPFYAARR
jgi:hypothetical protein